MKPISSRSFATPITSSPAKPISRSASSAKSFWSAKRPLQKIIAAELPEFASSRTNHQSPSLNSVLSTQFSVLALPYDFYTDTDIAHRVIYVEASRGCPFKCEFCLSSLDVPVRNVPLDDFLAAMQRLLDRGLRQFKFVDRTFNLNLKISQSILAVFSGAI